MRLFKEGRTSSCTTYANNLLRKASCTKSSSEKTTIVWCRFRLASQMAIRPMATEWSFSPIAQPSLTIPKKCCGWIPLRQRYRTTGRFSTGEPMKFQNPKYVLTRTPLRVSFAGGGTDLAAFYEASEYGAVLSTAINKYIYVTVKRHSDVFDEPIRVNYSKSEQVHRVEQIQNNIARECMRFLEIEPPIYISTVADLPASTGLGGSSSFAVGLLNALHAFRGERVSAGQLAEEASYIEIDVLKQPIGKQDQYAAAFGGLNFFSFKAGGAVTVEPQRWTNGGLKALFECILMFWTGHQRDSSSVLSEQKANTPAKMDSLLRIREHALQLQKLGNNGCF